MSILYFLPTCELRSPRLTFGVFGSFVFAMTTYGTAMVDYMIHYLSLSFVAFGPQSAADFAAALPSQAAPFADDLRAGATNAWGSFDAFKSGLKGDAAKLSDDVLKAAYAAGEPGRQFGWQAGWTTFYWICFFVAIPGMLLLFKVAPWGRKDPPI